MTGLEMLRAVAAGLSVFFLGLLLAVDRDVADHDHMAGRHNHFEAVGIDYTGLVLSGAAVVPGDGHLHLSFVHGRSLTFADFVVAETSELVAVAAAQIEVVVAVLIVAVVEVKVAVAAVDIVVAGDMVAVAGLHMVVVGCSGVHPVLPCGASSGLNYNLYKDQHLVAWICLLDGELNCKKLQIQTSKMQWMVVVVVVGEMTGIVAVLGSPG